MKSYNAKDIRNIAIAGHGGRGKTTLAEAMLFVAGASDRLGRVADGNTVMDFDPEEKKRTSSVSTAVAPLEWKNTKINLLDTPGKFDYAGGLSEGIRAAECVLVVTAAGSGFDVGAEKAIKAADSRNIAKFFAVTRTDAENCDFYKTFDALKAAIGAKLCPVVVPYTVDGVVKAYVNLASGKAFEYKAGKATEIAMPTDSHISDMRDILMETAASADEELMEKFFEEMELSIEDVSKGLAIGVASGDVYPVFACSGYTTDAVDMLLDAIVSSAPAASTCGEGDVE